MIENNMIRHSHCMRELYNSGERYEKRSLMAWVDVIPKEGWLRPSFFWYDTDF